MAFGENYAPVFTAPQLEDGEYRARIVKAELAAYSNGNEYCRVTLEIAGKQGYQPNAILLNEAPRLGTMKANGSPVEQADVDRANRQITTFFECFGIQDGNFNLPQWKGKIGLVKVAPQYDKNEPDHKSKTYKQIFPQKPKAQETQSAPVQVTAPAPQPAAPVQNNGGYPEDIPF